MKNISKVLRKVMLFGVLGIILVGGAGYSQGRVVGAETEEENTDEVIRSGKYDYRVLEDGTVELLKYHGGASDIKVPTSIDGKNVTVLGEFLYSGFNSLFHIEVPEGILQIKQRGLANNFSLTNIKFPSSLIEIEEGILVGCISLKRIEFPKNIVEIKNKTLFGCSKLEEVILSEDIELLGARAFENTNLYSILLGEKLKKIEEDTFTGCTNLNSVVILSMNAKLPAGVFPQTTILYGYKGSTVESYANQYGNPFIEFIPIQEITVSKMNIELVIGEKNTEKITVMTYPNKEMKNQKLQWISSNEDVAEVDAYGNITAVGNGTAIITVKALAESEAKATCTVKVSTAAKGIYFQTTSHDLDLGKMNANTTKLIPSYYPKTANYVEKIEWWTPDTEIIKVDQTGQVTALKNGTATVYAKISEDTWVGTAECKVKVSTSVNRINLNKTSVELVKGRPGEESIVLTANALPTTANNRSISWSSSDENILVVDKAGKITAKTTGTAYIVAKALDGSNAQGKCKVTVRPKVEGIRLEKSHIQLDLSHNKTSTAKIKEVSPDPYTRYTATWSSSNSKVATVSSKGKITAKSSGKTAVTVSVDGIKKRINVVVTPGKVPSFQVKSRTTSSITLTWKKSKEAQGYLIYRVKSNTKQYRLIGSCSANTTKYTDKGLSSGKVYQYRIVPAFNLKSEQLKGPYVAIKTATRPKTTSIVTLKSVANKSAKGIRISWKRIIGASGYEIYMSTKATTGYKKVGTTLSNNSCSYTKMGLKKGKKYYFKVRAYIEVNGKKIYGTYSKERNVKR